MIASDNDDNNVSCYNVYLMVVTTTKNFFQNHYTLYLWCIKYYF